MQLLTGPRLPRQRCLTCTGSGRVRLIATSLPRQCPTCRGSGLSVKDERFADGFDWRAHEIGLAPRRSAP